MEIKLSEIGENDLLNTLIISGGNVCKMLYVMEVVSLDVGTVVDRSLLLHGKDRVRQCPPLGFNFKPSLMVMVLNSDDGNGSFCSASAGWRRVTVIALFNTSREKPYILIKDL